MVRAKSEIWNYFDNVVEDGMAVCKTCHQRLRNNRSFNLRQHMRRIHNVYVDIPETTSAHSPYSPQPYDEEQINAMLKVAKRKMKEQPQNQQEKRIKTRIYIEMERKTIVRSLMGLMIEDGVGPHLFDSNNLQTLIKPICDAISDQERKEFKVTASNTERSLSQVAGHIRNDFSNDLHWRLLSLKIDTDLYAQSETYCVSAQFVNEGQVETRVLGVIDLKGSSQFTETHIKELLHKFNIDTNQIVAACWDNTKRRFNQQVENSEYIKTIDDFEKYPEISVGDVKVERYIGFIAQMCVLDIFKNSAIFQPLVECRNLTKYLNEKSNGYYQLLEASKLRIPELDSPWKWGSTYTMINDLHLGRNLLQNVKFEKLDCPEEQFVLNDKLWSFIEAFSKVLSFMQKSILRYYGEELHFGDFYAQWLKSKLLTEKVVGVNNQNNFITLIANELLKTIEKRSKELLQRPRFEACLYLDPRFQHTLNLLQKANALEYLKNIWCRAKIYNADVVNPSGEAESSMQLQFDDDEDAFLNEFLSQDMQLKDITTAGVYARIERFKLPFQMVDTNILFFWRELKYSEPELHALSSICFAMPATQVYSKVRYSRIFNVADSPRISKHSEENIMFIRLNLHLLDYAIEQVCAFKDDDSALADEADKEQLIVPLKYSNEMVLPSNPTMTTSISTLSMATAIITATGTAFLPPNITIKSVNASN